MASSKPLERLFKYPPMQRHDLNQSQLGSFKFTPVDPVNNIQSLTQSAKDYLEQQLYQKISRLHPSSAENFHDTASTLSSERLVSPPKAPVGDTDFFNKHIKPDLGDSRLRLGPAALRSAVDGSVSPTKNGSYSPVRQETDPLVIHHRPSSSFDAPQVVSPHFEIASTMDPTASAFMPGTELLSPGLSDSASFNNTLCVALANEQRAHQLTKAALSQQIIRNVELEDQLKRSKQQVVSMTTTINNLGAIIKHNASKQNSEDSTSYNHFGSSEDAEEAALKEFYREHQKLKDAVKEREERQTRQETDLKEPHQVNGLPKKDTVETASASPLGKTIDDAQLYNLELLQKPDECNSTNSVLRRTLRKHFSLDSGANDVKPLATPSKQRGVISKLVDISPESMEVSLIGEENNMSQDNSNEDGSGLMPMQIRLLSGKPVSVTEPENSIKKYDHKQALKETLNGVDATMEHLTKLGSLRLNEGIPQSSTDHPYGRASPVPSLHKNDGQSNKAIVSSIGAQPKTFITIQIGDNLHGEPKWKINKDNPIFRDEQEKRRVMVHDNQKSTFFQHPVRYLPEDAASTINAYRTVMIDGIPTGTTVVEILNIVRGGSLESVQLFPPIGNATSDMTARIVFNHEVSAHNMIKHQQAQSGQDVNANRFRINDVAVRCWMPTDPTYPCDVDIKREVFGDSHASRIIVISNVDEYLFDMIPYKIEPPYDQHVIEYSYTLDGCASIEFSGVKTALKVMAMLRIDRDLWTTTLQYDDDYTCAPYA